MNIGEAFKFVPNRVKRLYTGGSGIERLRGEGKPSDGNFPEDWIASCVRANSRDVPPEHGLSEFFDVSGKASFPELLKTRGAEILGERHFAKYGPNPGFLSKLLDSAMRLPLQVHPDRTTAKSLFNSQYGKTEAWLVFATREVGGEKPYILLGFNERLDKDVFERESLSGEYKTGLSMLHKFEVAPGGVYVVLGRMPHAIGPGVTMVEVMEPTDITINPERLCCDYELPLERRFAKLEPQVAMSVFDYAPRSREETLAICAPAPETLEKRPEGELKLRIPRSKYKFFEAQELSFKGSWRLDLSSLRSFRVGIVVEGSLKAGSLPLRGGESFFVPASCEDLKLEGEAEIVFLLPPEA
jgi:mannose-6-phosphate isomerase